MRWSIALTFAAAMLLGGHSVGGDDNSSPAKQIQITVRVFEGDPRGSLEAGTLKVLVDSHVTTLENRPFSLVSGGEMKVAGSKGDHFIEYGHILEGKPGVVTDGKIRLDVALSNTTVGEKSDERIQLNTESTRTIFTATVGETVKMGLRAGGADKRTWAELTVVAVRP